MRPMRLKFACMKHEISQFQLQVSSEVKLALNESNWERICRLAVTYLRTRNNDKAKEDLKNLR
jgi:hypothetical protein